MHNIFICRFVVFFVFLMISPVNSCGLDRLKFFPFVVFMAPVCDGISDSDNTSCHEAAGMNIFFHVGEISMLLVFFS